MSYVEEEHKIYPHLISTSQDNAFQKRHYQFELRNTCTSIYVLVYIYNIVIPNVYICISSHIYLCISWMFLASCDFSWETCNLCFPVLQYLKKNPNFIKIEMYCSLKLLQLSQSEDFEILENNTTLLLFFFSLSCLISQPFDVATF